MNISIQSRIKNPFLKREEIEAVIDHDNGTPNLNEMQQELSKVLMAKKEYLVISKVIPRFGIKQLKIKAHVYESAEAMQIEVGKKEKEKKGEEKKG
ncbi:MAG: hypothetical protein QW112_01385 [Candidatus Micrarchaeia archaeon]